MATRQEIIAELAETRDISNAEAGRVLEDVLSIIFDGVFKDGVAKLGDEYGSLKLGYTNARSAKNPKDPSVIIPVPEGSRVKLVQSKALKVRAASDAAIAVALSVSEKKKA